MPHTNPHLLSEDGSRQFKYFAFISYKHKDKPWARWVQQKLENYRLPARLCKETDRPRRLVPIFRDETDLTSGDTVHALLDQKLRESKFLIVICSRHMQDHPEYIDFEIQRFLEMGNPLQNVLPLIVDGVGCAADPSQEAFPPALLSMGDARPLGITVEPKRRQDAILKLVAAMHRIDLQAIRTHDQARRQRRILLSMASGLALSLALGGFMAWEVHSVRQAKLREQNVYAEDTYREGDRLRARDMAAAVLAETDPFMADTISQDARTLQTLADIEPALSPLTLLETARSDKAYRLDQTGSIVIVQTEDRIRHYGLTGQLLLDRTSNGLGQKFIALSPDGDHAVVLSAFEEGKDVTLWLCSLVEGTRIAPLISASAFDEKDLSAGRYDSILDARFSPDGQTLVAYRAGGYYNASTELAVFDAVTGEKTAALDAALLGDAGQGTVVQDFAFVSDTLLHWTGPQNHVLYDLTTQEVHSIPAATLAIAKNRGMAADGHFQLGWLRQEDGALEAVLLDCLSETLCVVPLPEGGMDVQSSHVFGQHFALVAGRNSKGYITQVTLIDARTMTATDLAESGAKYGRVDVYASPNEEVYYLHLADSQSWSVSDRLLRLDISTGEWTAALPPDGLSELTCAGRIGDAEWFFAPTPSNDKTRVLQWLGGDLEAFLLDAPYADFILAQGSAAGGMLLAKHDDQLALFPTTEAGMHLDRDVSWSRGSALCAASADGTLIVKACGPKLAVFSGTDLLWEFSEEQDISLLEVAPDGSRILWAAGQQVTLCTPEGIWLAQGTIQDSLYPSALTITADGLIILAESVRANTGAHVPAGRLQILDGSTLESIALVGEHVYDAPGDTPPAFAVSADGKYLALVNARSSGTTYRRDVFLCDARTGELLARTNLEPSADDALPVMDVASQNVGIHDFSYVRFAASGMLLAGQASGVWCIDPASRQPLGFTPIGRDITGMPDQLTTGELLYPAGDVYLLDAASGAVRTLLPAEEAHTALLSPDGEWIALADQSGIRLTSAASPDTAGTVTSREAQLLHFDDRILLYTVEDRLYLLTYRPE